ncbi:MAG: hypothetical protein K2W96_09810 [Gemmataceae bacterium]|nr:hypothetical protein [Gemmataceae bacterium]
MSLPLEFHPAVRDEIDDAQDWYEQRRAGLGQEFLDEVERVLAVYHTSRDPAGWRSRA